MQYYDARASAVGPFNAREANLILQGSYCWLGAYLVLGAYFKAEKLARYIAGFLEIYRRRLHAEVHFAR